MKAALRLATILVVVGQLMVGPTLMQACTGVTIRPKDGSVIFGRTLEFASDLKSNIIIVPRGQAYVGTAPGNKPGLRWENKYGIVGANGLNLPQIVDGINEQGLSFAIFYFPGYAQFQEVEAAQYNETLAPWELGTYLLGTCNDVKSAVAAVKNIRVGKAVQPEMGACPPIHYILSDASGQAVVLEYVGGELHVHANPLGVMANSPTFDWHVTNLSNYVNLSVTNVPQIKLDGQELNALGQGSGMLGLPGDFTPPSRFVRAAAFSKAALPVDSASEGVLQVFHLLNQFDIPKGIARSVENGQIAADYTMWTSVSDLKNLRYHFRTYSNSRIRMIDLKAVDFDVPGIKTISMQGAEQIEDVTSQAK